MWKRTSPDGLVVERSTSPPGAILADFDIDHFYLKHRHIQWLNERVVAAMKAKQAAGAKGQWVVEMYGRASQSGGSDYNKALSMRRVEAVKQHLMSQAVGVPIVFNDLALGESKPADAAIKENELDRSVEIRATFQRSGTPPPNRRRRLIPINPWRPRDRKLQDFTIRALATDIEMWQIEPPVPFGLADKGHVKVKMLLKIEEWGGPESALYVFEGEGPITFGNSSKGKLPGFSEWSQRFRDGRRHRFATKGPMEPEDFAGGASAGIDTALDLGTLSKYRFGPVDPIWGPSINIRDMDLGDAKDPPSPLTGEGGMTPGAKMKLVASAPSWAK